MSDEDSSEAPIVEPQDIRQRAISGIGWTFASQAVRQSISFGLTIVLARLIAPEVFGLVGMVTVFTGFASVLQGVGLGQALVQHRAPTEVQFSSIFWLNNALGLAIMAVFSAASPLLAAFYGRPELILLTVALSASVPIRLLGLVHSARLLRELEFRKLAYVDAASLAVGGTLAVLLAIQGAGPYALVAQDVGSAAGATAGYWLIARWRPRFRIEWQGVKELLGFGTNLTGFQMWNYAIRNSDNLLIGKVAGAVSLGLYTRAYALMMLMENQVGGVLSRVMFPALSRIQDDRERVKRIYLKSVGAIAVITFPAMVGLAAVADEFIVGLLGARWAGAAPLLQVLAVAGMLTSIGTTTGWLYQSQGRADLMFRWGVFAGVVTLTGFAIGIHWGALGVAWSYVIRSLVLIYFTYTIPGRLVGMRFGEVVRAVRGALGCALLMVAAVLAVKHSLPSALRPLVKLAIEIPVGVVAYGLTVVIARPRGYEPLRQLAAERLHRLRA